MFILKACPKCKGDLAADTRRLNDEADVACIQCGYYLRPAEQQRLFARLFLVTAKQEPIPVPALAFAGS